MATATEGGRLVKAGRLHDIEDDRTTFRLQGAASLLRSQGLEGTWAHADTTTFDWPTRRERHTCDHQCRITWPEWATDEMFDQAYALSALIQGARGSHHRAQAYAAKAGRA